jgi:spore coat polysaccharide biosynthesis protein SpsF (cytidylyltransferase family)
LPNKCFLEFGEGNVLEHMIRRAKFFGFDPIVCTTTESSDDQTASVGKSLGVRVFRGSTEDKLDRWSRACEAFRIDRFVSMDADDPFFSKKLSIASLETLDSGCDLVKHHPEQPSNGFYEGCVGYSLTTDIVKKACEIKKTSKTEMMWHFIERVPGVEVKHLEVEGVIKMGPIRLTLDYEEDYWLLRTILRNVGPYADYDEVSEFIQKNPGLGKINWFRNDDYLAGHKDLGE